MGIDVGKYENTKEYILKAKEKLTQSELLTEDEADELSQKISNLPKEEIVPETKNKGDMSLNIDELISEFNDYANNSTSKLEEMLAIISEGRVPSVIQRDELNSVISNLCEKYESVKNVAETELYKEELPTEGSSVAEYYNAVKNSKSALINSKIKEIEGILSKFISVQSLVAKYTDALAPLQHEAKVLLNRIDEGNIDDIDEITEEASGPELFMKALECEDLNTDEGNDMLDSLIDNYSYPLYVTRGLVGKSYFIPENVETDDIENVEAESENISPLVSDSKSSEVNNSEEEDKILVLADDTGDKVDSNKTETEPELEKEPEKEHSAFRIAIEDKGIALDDAKFGLLTKEISPAETKKVTASVFTSDLRKGNTTALKYVVKQLISVDITSPQLVKIECGISEDMAEACLDFLQKKGYTRKYGIIPGGEFYCVTPKLERALTFKDASKFVDVKQLHDVSNGTIEDRVSSAYARLILLKLYTNTAINNNKAGIKKSSLSYSLNDAMFAFATHDSTNDDILEILAGAFWTNYDEADDFYENIKKYFVLNKNITYFVLAAFNREIANVIMTELIKLIPDKTTENFYLYAANEDKYYSYAKDVEVKAEDIWKYLGGSEQEENVKAEGSSSENTEIGSDTVENTKDEVKIKEEKIHVDKSDGKASGLEDDRIADNKENCATMKLQVVKHGADDSKSTVTIPKNSNQEEIIYKFLIERKIYCAPAYVRALSLKDHSWDELYDRIAYAVNDPMKHCTYFVDSVFDLVPDSHSVFSDDLMVAIGIRTFFSNQVRYDFNIKAFYNAIKDYAVLRDYSSLSNVVYKLADFKDIHKKGMDAYADYHAKSVAQLDEELKRVRQEAKIFYESIILAKKQEKASQRRFLETKKLLFNVNGEIGQFIKCVSEDEKDMQPLAVEFLQNNFIKEGNVLAEDTIDSDMLWNYIMIYWDKAGENMMMKLRADLMSHLRSNIVNITTKALQIIIHWCNLVEKINDRAEDEGSIVYKKIRKVLLNDIHNAINEISTDAEDENVADDEKAGLAAIIYALDDISKCIEGTYEENERKYFYAPFLFTDDILLDESFCPNLETHGAEVAELQPEYRIIEHANKKAEDAESRLKAIFEDSGDDIGTARLILEYLGEVGSKIDISGYMENLDSSEEYAKEDADLKKGQFIGDLELAQSYGQIDNSNASEDKKEKILQIVDAWYEDSLNSSNYGFFARVMNSYISEIRRESKSREKDLFEQLEALKGVSIKGISAEDKDKKIKKIQAAIEQQNYTVAEDLLAHANQPDSEHDSIVEEDFLKDFLNDYNDYYMSVAKSQISFAALVSNRTRNKEERGGRRLADNWLPGGSRLGKERLVALLSGFGFKVDSNSVQEQGQIVRFENYNVRTLKATNGKKEIYTHPIAAFGSGAAEEGFRVVCINGKYDAAGLINLMKQIGNAKHTMILLDCALDKPERRILARKSKTELGDKLFVVIDRTVMMYMVKNYDETKANRMLMSLIVPFGYYQPYVWESSNVMPPEIFMGRKHELESIESPTGANIVYGGRQLGKSALLKKAKLDIDKDENGDRAVLVEIKGLNYESAAKKIGHALYDEGILTEDIDTTDWNDLSRAIRKRLQSDNNRIQYLLLLLDEADAFIESCEAINYQPFDALKEIQSIGSGRFKFVIAGLRNIVRFKRDAALGNNSVLTHLESMTVKPFQTAEARELMEIPLHYLGLEFPKKNEYLMTLILATTNYFPGLIQMYCAKLLTAMRNKDYAGYDEADTPVYEISEDHIKKVLADSEFTEQIREKFFITLKLDQDYYYYLIALIMASLYHKNGYNEGYSALDIKNAAKNFYIAKIATLDDGKLIALMEELKELNVLRNTDESHYLFSKFSFFQMMGTSTEVDDKLEEYMED